MKTFKITYKSTGSNRLDYVCISEFDVINNKKVTNVVDAIERFEEIAAAWGTYETKNAIVKIEVL